MAFPDDYTQWGGTTADFTTTLYAVKDGVDVVRAKAVAVTIWDGAGDDATQVTDLYDHNMAPVTDLETSLSGLLRIFWAPASYGDLWASADEGTRVQLVPHRLPPGDYDDLINKPATFPPSPHAHTVGDIVSFGPTVQGIALVNALVYGG